MPGMLAAIVLALSACGGGQHSGSQGSSADPSGPLLGATPPASGQPGGDPPPASGTPTGGLLNLNSGASIRQYTPGASVVVPLALTGASGGAALPVTIISSDPKIATASPATCFLVTSGSGSSCPVTLRTIAAGTATLTATASGYDPVSTQVVVGGSPPEQYNYGEIQIAAFPSASAPSTMNFPMTAQLGQIVTLQVSLTGFDQPLDGVPIFLQTTTGSIVGNPQCNVDSTVDANHTCLYQVQLPSTAPAGNTVTVTAHVVGNPASFQAWNSPTVTITTTSGPVPGSIVLESLDGSAPRGMSSPMWAVLRDSSGVGDTVVSLQASSSNVTINPGIASTSGPYQKQSCTLSSANPVCGFGVQGQADGTVSIGAAASPGSYVIDPLFFTINEPLTAARILKFRNTGSTPVWLGITSGTSNSYQTRALISDSSGNGPNKMCGPSNPHGACSRGSTCQQGGAYPDEKTTYFCYWDQAAPSSGYEIITASAQTSSTGTPVASSAQTTSTSGTTSLPDTTTVSISQSSYDPIADITWSGNFFPREGCTLTNTGELTCVVADCGNAFSGQGCAPGTGGAPAVATLPEVTLQRYNTDYYDISIIGGANVATSFGPDRSAASTDNPIPDADGYMCTTAGFTTAQGALPASDWDMATHVAEPLVSGEALPFSQTAQTAAVPSSSFYELVSTVTPREAPGCSASSACTTPGSVCGYDAAAVNRGAISDYQTSCGTHVAWLSANQLWAMNTTTSNAAPFHFSGSYQAASGPTIQLNQLFSCTAPTASGYDTANFDSSVSCGCTNWGDSVLASVPGDATFATGIAAPSIACSTNNTVGSQYLWTANVLPTIAWLKQGCPTCYTYPFDDMSSTFQCTNNPSTPDGTNSIPYIITFSGHLRGR